MSETIIFAIGSGVFATTVWGSVMAAGVLLGRIEGDPDPEPAPTEPKGPTGQDESPPKSS